MEKITGRRCETDFFLCCSKTQPSPPPTHPLPSFFFLHVFLCSLNMCFSLKKNPACLTCGVFLSFLFFFPRITLPVHLCEMTVELIASY